MGPSWPTRREFSMGLILGLVLQRNQLTDEGVGERFERTGTVFGWERGGRADHELAQPGLHVLLDQPARAVPADRDQRGRIGVRPPAADRGRQRIGHAVQHDGHAEAEVIGLHLPPGVGGGLLDRRDRHGRLGRGGPGAEPALRQPRRPHRPPPRRPPRRRPAGAEPPSQISSGLAGSTPTLAPDTVKNAPSNDTVSEVSSSRSSVSDSSNTAAPPPSGTGNSTRSAAWAGCRPNTGSTRPGARPASDASCLATSTGWRPGSTEIPVPTFSR